MLANTVRAICTLPLAVTFYAGAVVMTALGWWLLSVVVLGGAPDPRIRTMAKPKNDTVDVDSLDFAQPSSTRGRSGQLPSVCSARRYKDTFKLKIGDEALAKLGLDLGTRAKPVKLRVEAAIAGGTLYVRHTETGGWSLGKHHGAQNPPAFGEVAFTGAIAAAVFDYCGESLAGASVEVDWAIDRKMLAITLPTASE